MLETYLHDLWQIGKMILMFLAIVVGRKLFKWFAPMIFMIGRKPWK